jgi:carboxypeptidase family protein
VRRTSKEKVKMVFAIGKRGERCRLRWLLWIGLPGALCGLPAIACAQDAAAPAGQTKQQTANPQETGNIRGKVVDQTGVEISGASVKLTRPDPPSSQETETDEEGQFYFFNVAPGPYSITITSEGLTTETVSGTVTPRETNIVPQVKLAVAQQVTQLTVGLPVEEIAQEQIEEQEKQRILGFVPNFYVSYVPNAAPMNAKQKYKLATRTLLDPMTFASVGLIAGANHAAGRWKGYGGGIEGYSKRFGSSYADVATGTFIGGAVLPSLLKQDPRYFYQGTGSKKSRLWHALSNSFICKGDDGRMEPNYSNIGGNLAAGGLATLYYPRSSGHSWGLALSVAGTRLAETTAVAVLQEFILPKLTPGHGRQVNNQP